MKYLADVLTALRFVAAVVVGFAAWQDAWLLATTVFIVGILSDAFDGPAARKWPYSVADDMRLPWRRDPHFFDNAADLALSTAGLLGLTFSQLSFVQACIVIAAVAAISFYFVRTVEWYARHGRPDTAEKFDVAHGFMYGAELATMLVVMTALVSEYWPFMVFVYIICAIPLLWFKRDRITSRSEVDYSRT